MTIEERVDRLEAKLGSQDELVQQLREAARLHARFAADHERGLAHDLSMKDLDVRIRDLVSGFGEFIRRVDRR